MDFCFVHAADLHLDSPISATPRAEESARPLLEAATFKAFERVVDLCLARKAAFLLLAGDLFDKRDRSVRARLAVHDQLARLDRAGIRTFVVHGNHDPLSGDTGTLRLPPSVKVFGPEWEEVVVQLESGSVCRIQGMSYATERVEANLALRYSRQGPELTIGLLHANVGGSRAHANYSPASWDDLSERCLDYWALGHVHTRTEKELASGGRAVYPGNPQGRHAYEPGERGCMVVEVQGNRCSPEFVPVDSVRWQMVRVPLEGLEDLGALEQEIGARIEEVCQGAVDGHAVRVVLEGRSPLHVELARIEDREALEAHVRELLRQRTVPVVLELLVDESEPMVDFESVRAEGGLAATLFDVAESVDPARLWAEGNLKGLDELLKRAGMPALGDDAPALVEAAARRAVELLSEDRR